MLYLLIKLYVIFINQIAQTQIMLIDNLLLYFGISLFFYCQNLTSNVYRMSP